MTVYSYVFKYIHVCVYVCISSLVHGDVYVYVCVYVYASCMHVCMMFVVWSLYVCMHVCLQAHLSQGCLRAAVRLESPRVDGPRFRRSAGNRGAEKVVRGEVGRRVDKYYRFLFSERRHLRGNSLLDPGLTVKKAL